MDTRPGTLEYLGNPRTGVKPDPKQTAVREYFRSLDDRLKALEVTNAELLDRIEKLEEKNKLPLSIDRFY
jgi:hypothetical protein